MKNETDISRYYIRDVGPQDYEWGFCLDNGDRIRKIVRPKANVFLDHHMYGFAYWVKDDLNQIVKEVERAYKSRGHEDLAYDEVINRLYGKLNVGVLRLASGQLYEIDNLDDLVGVDPSYASFLNN